MGITGIIADFRADYEKEKRRQAQAGNTPREMNLDEQTTKAVATVRRYKISRAQKMLRSKGLADTDDPNIGDQLKALHLKTRDHDMPEREGGWEIKIDNIERTIGELDTDTGTGPNGMPAQLLRALIGQAEGGSGARTTSQERSPITAFANHWANLRLPPRYYKLTGGATLLAAIKTQPEDGEVPRCRPVAVGDVLRRTLERAVWKELGPHRQGVLRNLGWESRVGARSRFG